MRHNIQNPISPGFAIIHDEIFHSAVLHHECEPIGIHEHGFEKFNCIDLPKIDAEFMLIIERCATFKNDPLIGEFKLASNSDVVMEVTCAIFKQYIFSHLER